MSETNLIRASHNTIPDFTGVQNFEDVQTRFINSALSIMFEHQLEYRPSKHFEITALELYLKLHQQRHIWWDPATDEDANAQEQFNQSTWYVRQKKGPGYWRIDITAGCRSSGIQAGLLVAQLDCDAGSGKAFQKIIRGDFHRRGWTREEQDRIQQIHGRRIDGEDGSPLKLVRRTIPIRGAYYVGGRKNIPEHRDALIRDAPLRISTSRMKPRDKEYLRE